MSVTPVSQRRPPVVVDSSTVRVRHQVRDAAVLMAFSMTTASLVALLLLLVVRVGR